VLDNLAATGNISGTVPPTSLAAPTSPAATTATPAAAGGGVTDTLTKALNNPLVKLGIPLGALGFTLARGAPQIPSAAQAAVSGPGATATSRLAADQLTAAANGEISPSQAAQIEQFQQDPVNQLFQVTARQGRDPRNDTDFIQGLGRIEQSATAMRQQFIDSMIKNGLAAQGVTNTALQNAANLQVASDTAFRQSINSALQSFGLVAALSSIK